MKLHTFVDLNPFHWVGGLLGGVAHTVAGSIIGVIAKAIMQALNQAIVTIGTLWVQVRTPDLITGGTASSTPSGTVSFIQGQLHWYVTALAVGGVLVGTMRMAWEQRAEPGLDVMRGLAVYVVVSGAGLSVVAILVSAADSFSSWIIANSAGGGDFQTGLAGMLAFGATGGTLATMLVIILGLVALLASLVQIVLMVVRGGMLVLLCGVLPATAAFTNTRAGREWFRKSCSWLVAFILYKPAAAIIYATAFRLSDANVFASGGLGQVIAGLTLMMLALLALPALMRFVMPMVGATAAGGMAGILGAGAGVAAMAAMPTGAIGAAAMAGGAGLAGGAADGGGGGGSAARPIPTGSRDAPSGSAAAAPDSGSSSSGRDTAAASPGTGPARAKYDDAPPTWAGVSTSGAKPTTPTIGTASPAGAGLASANGVPAAAGQSRVTPRVSGAGVAPDGAAIGSNGNASRGAAPARETVLPEPSTASGASDRHTAVPHGVALPGASVARSLGEQAAAAADGAVSGSGSSTGDDPSGSERSER